MNKKEQFLNSLKKSYTADSDGIYFGAGILAVNDVGLGTISLLRLMDLQDKPKLFSIFLLCLLAEIYGTFPEVGDLDKPKLVIFIDEAHLLFKNATPELLNQMETIIKLIRSKGVGIYFCTQNPTDIPNAILSQLGLKIQHALRVFTAKDRKALKLVAENYPLSDFYKTDKLLTSLGIGEAAITGLDTKGRPTPLVSTLLVPPRSRMGPLKKQEIENIISQSVLAQKYNQTIDRESAHEILTSKLQEADELVNEMQHNGKSRKKESKTLDENSWADSLSQNAISEQVSQTLVREVVRGLLGVLGLSGSRRHRRY